MKSDHKNPVGDIPALVVSYPSPQETESIAMDSDASEPDTTSALSQPVGAREAVPRSALARRARLLAGAAGVVGALLGWGAGESTQGWFQPARAASATNPMAVQFDSAELDRVDVENATLAHGLQGAILGLALGIAGGLAGGSARRAAVAGLIGLVAGGVLGAGASFASFTLLFRTNVTTRGDLLPSLLSHAGAWMPLGAASGLAFGLGLGGRGRIGRALIGGLVGAGVAALLYDTIGSIVFPLGKTSEPIAATAPARLFAQGCVGLCTALGSAILSETAGQAPRRIRG